ncbi:transcriptional activator RfaH [Jiella sp. 40Bstr34]|uniref:Transcriptional activator RfaH n=2 Tax=Jiella pacifica TaxID=2696469 RepID=A0A6N9SZA5_9HYPH|nr:transcriptional activator RfaH [Jiella pacifica]
MAETHLLRQGFGVFLPLLRCGETRARRARPVLAPLFPGYVFAGFDPRAAGWRRVNGTYGVKKLVSFGETPEPVPPTFMAALRHSCDEMSIFSFRRASAFREGDRVKLAAGPFMGMIGEIEAMGGPDRAWLLLAILGRTARVSVGLDELQKIA